MITRHNASAYIRRPRHENRQLLMLRHTLYKSINYLGKLYSSLYSKIEKHFQSVFKESEIFAVCIQRIRNICSLY